MLGKEQLLAADRTVTTHTVDSLGGEIGVMPISAKAVMDWQEKFSDDDTENENAAASLLSLIVMCVADENGTLLFTDADIPRLIDTWSFGTIKEVFDVCADVLGLGSPEDAAKN